MSYSHRHRLLPGRFHHPREKPVAAPAMPPRPPRPLVLCLVPIEGSVSVTPRVAVPRWG